ncbi:hypothetical protein BSR29_04460 [Boudabousia liubingyangii]|uniref:RNA polymerase-binding protein RbpA n=1 Tax=Boudabousia liubingyangii TaxID=1921764 RepID=A0A1Q5PNT4_9ACTO|nr:RNA polymerase-binding protein RbpA [Boudabousia liubingyangii]OKL47664.1 hypothetical protein BSR28_04025 [Boudabousia liubingyangii]OKL49090.1 hypothetical protein BSR29_04460 [Boudabousia liubingyangii]
MSANSPGPIRGSKIGASAPRPDSQVSDAPRFSVNYYCENGHVTKAVFSANIKGDYPEEWSCEKCGQPAGLDAENPPVEPKTVPFKTHLDYVKERRSDEDGERILDEALDKLRNRFGRAR